MDRAKDLLQNLSTYDSEWRILINSLDNSIEKCHLQSIATASVLIYCGRLPESKRIEKFRKWTNKWQNSHGNLLNDTDYAALLDEEKKEISSLWRITNLPWENHCINGSLILNHTTRYPLIIDPYNISSQWINALSSTKETKPVYLDAANPRYLEQLSGCLQLGATAVLSVTDCGYDPALTSLLLKQTFSQGTSFFVKLGANVVEFSGEFQLFLVAKQPRADFQHVTVVDFTLEDLGLFETFVSAFVNNERPDSEERIQLAKQNSEIFQQRSELETNLLNSLIATESDWIEKETVINTLLPNLIQSRMLKEKLAVVEQAQHRLETQRESFIPTAKFSSKIVKILSTSKYFSVSLDHFLQIVLGSLEDDDGEDDVDADPDEPLSKTSSVFRQISGRIFRKLKPGLNFLQKRLLSLVLCFYTAIEEETITEEFFQKFINGSGTELVELVQEQSGNPGEFQVFLQDLSAGPLMLSTVLEKFAKKFLKINFNVELEEYVNIVMNLPQSTPVLILASLNVDIEFIIQKLAKELDFPDDRIRYSATSSQNALNFVEMEDCMRRGNWLILQGFSHLRNQEENIHFLMENINSEGVSPDFRMWIVWRTETRTDLEHLNNVPHNLLGKCRHFIFTEPQWSAWEVVREMFQWGKFQKLLTNPSETTKMLFSSLVCLRVIIWDRWNVLVPVTYLIRLLELSTMFQDTPDWNENITVLLFENLKETIEAYLHTEVRSILEELISRSNTRWNEIIDTIGQFVTKQTEADLNPVLQLVDFDCFCQREQTISEKLWKLWRKMFQKVE